jgi:hypothetical protein
MRPRLFIAVALAIVVAASGWWATRPAPVDTPGRDEGERPAAR